MIAACLESELLFLVFPSERVLTISTAIVSCSIIAHPLLLLLPFPWFFTTEGTVILPLGEKTSLLKHHL